MKKIKIGEIYNVLINNKPTVIMLLKKSIYVIISDDQELNNFKKMRYKINKWFLKHKLVKFKIETINGYFGCLTIDKFKKMLDN